MHILLLSADRRRFWAGFRCQNGGVCPLAGASAGIRGGSVESHGNHDLTAGRSVSTLGGEQPGQQPAPPSGGRTPAGTGMKKKSHDDAQEDLVRLYLNEIGQHELLTKADEERLGRAIEVGHEAGEALLTTPKLTPARKRELKAVARAGERATRQFTLSNLRLVVSIAKKYQASGL